MRFTATSLPWFIQGHYKSWEEYVRESEFIREGDTVTRKQAYLDRLNKEFTPEKPYNGIFELK